MTRPVPQRAFLRRYFASRAVLLFIVPFFLNFPEVLAEGSESVPVTAENLFFALPAEVDVDSGASNGDAIILRLMPLYSIPVNSAWKLVNLDLITIADAPGGRPGQPGNPNPESGECVLGIGDLIHASFATPNSTGSLAWGVGAIISIPIASEGQLGSGKWSGGPAARIAYKKGEWNFGAFGGQQWSFAGDDERSDVSQLMVRALIRRPLPDK